MTIKNLRLGVAIGHGTGRELTVVFKKVIQELARPHSLQVDFIESSRIYHSYHSLTTSSGEKDLIQHIADETTQDAEEYRKFCETATANGIAAIFRTAIHAQSLYLVRDQLKAVKIEHFNLGNSNALLFIRDEAQGFYAGENEYCNGRYSITRTSAFTRSTFDQIFEYALERAKEEWGVANVPKAVTLVYKFHLFDGVFQAWAPHWQRRFGIELDFIQPDTMNRNLMASGIQGRRIIIAGNEYADIIQPVFLRWFSNATIETMCAENVYLCPRLYRLTEYQTVHGSADAITGQGLVNPFATIRAAAAILERHGGCPGVGFQKQTERAIQTLLMKKLTTPDQGGSCSTDVVVGHFLRAIADPLALDKPSIRGDIATGPVDPVVGKKIAVVVVDYQNDFISSTPSHVVSELSNTMPRLSYSCASWATPVIKGLVGSIGMHCSENQRNASRAPGKEESTVRSLANNIKQTHPKASLRLALTVPGILHVEKSPSQIDAHAALESLKVNTLGPMLLMKYLTPFLPTRSSPDFEPCDGELELPKHAIYAMMAARVGSVSDNRMGGWYSYRASKAAVFQLAKTLDLYLGGNCRDRAISLALHPGTVKTDFTKSYQDGREMLSAEESAERLLGVLCSLGLEGRGKCWDWKGDEICP
ncbi:hypothetical protein BDV38DRAFT_276288 [Aspergillus pseudotamarii]|uniref:Isopropylmalate dehydrogenase-like domain-containing protein n=1 Tax=Aspergillus pseudotamarii TaxID=132259 RepID=A0A5N6S8Q1_ASPPS|nr:uncharacterized protein BDV38DRAFT_276288 [Aspergillus pseudotamarii]KAE8131048.1 hypothetical protein BDV38DRAFT_276288 [Aspergillus pseudotamarii]